MVKYELTHWGIKGQKWGVRRYQNSDGTLTPAGKKRRKQEVHEDYARAHDNKSVSQMSDRELKERNKRLEAERQYANLTKKTGKGKKAVQAYIATAGTIAGIATATATYAKFANKAIDKIGDKVVKDIVMGPVH